jgi:hypothetical protein
MLVNKLFSTAALFIIYWFFAMINEKTCISEQSCFFNLTKAITTFFSLVLLGLWLHRGN